MNETNSQTPPSILAATNPDPKRTVATAKFTRSGRRRVKRANLFTGSQTRNRHAAKAASRMPRLPMAEAMKWLTSQFPVELLVFLAAVEAGLIVEEPDGTLRGLLTTPESDKPQNEPAPSPADQQGGAP